MFDPAKANLPMNLWNVVLEYGKNWPADKASWDAVSAYLEDPEAKYLAGTNLFVVGGTRAGRQPIMSYITNVIGNTPNRYYRFTGESKIHEPGSLELAPGFRVYSMNVVELVSFYMEDSDTFDDRLEVFDWLFITESGSEWASTFTGRVLRDALYAREASGLPVVMSVHRKPSEVIDKNGVHVYLETSDIITGWERARL